MDMFFNRAHRNLRPAATQW